MRRGCSTEIETEQIQLIHFSNFPKNISLHQLFVGLLLLWSDWIPRSQIYSLEYEIVYIYKSLKRFSSQFGKKLFTSCTLVHWLKFGIGHDHGRRRPRCGKDCMHL